MFGKDDTLMWGGGKAKHFAEVLTCSESPSVMAMDIPIEDTVMPSPEQVPDHVLDIIRPLLITYGAGGSADAETLRRSITRWGYGKAIPEWFNLYSGQHVPKQTIAHLIYELFYYAIKHGDIERDTMQSSAEDRVKQLVLKLSNSEQDHYLYLAKGRREKIDGVNTDVFDFPITKQINRHELPEAFRDAFKKQAITVYVEGVTKRDGELYPTGTTQLNLKEGQEQAVFHSLEIIPEASPCLTPHR